MTRELKPSDIEYSQRTISDVFTGGEHAGKRITDTLAALWEGRCSIGDIPPISVAKHNKKWLTMDNRRLWVFKELEKLGKCNKIQVLETNRILKCKMTRTGSGNAITIRGLAGDKYTNKDGSHDSNNARQIQMASETNGRSRSSPEPAPGSKSREENKKICRSVMRRMNREYDMGNVMGNAIGWEGDIHADDHMDDLLYPYGRRFDSNYSPPSWSRTISRGAVLYSCSVGNSAQRSDFDFEYDKCGEENPDPGDDFDYNCQDGAHPPQEEDYVEYYEI